MKALDTNVLARAILNDDAKQSPLAQKYIKSNLSDGLYISPFTVVELVWVIKATLKKAKVCAVIEQLLQTEGFLIGQKHLLTAALHDYKNLNGDFADYVIVQDALAGANANLTSFDKKLCKGHKNTMLLKA